MWTRNGQYEVDKFGYIVTAQGNYLTGYQADDDGNITTGTTPAKIYLDPKPLSPAQTTEVNLSLNLDARKVAPSVAFDYTGNTLPPDPLSYNDSTSMTVYDTLGNPHVLSVYFITENTATTYSGIWDTAYTIDGINMTQGPKLPFTTSGALDTDTASANNFQTLNGVTFDPNAIPLDGSPGSTTLGFASSVVSAVPPETSDLALTFGTLPTLNLTGTSQYGAKFGINDQSQDGYTAGKLSSISVSPEGIVQGNYDNGNTRDIAQLALATFNNPNGLQSLGGNNWAETGASGQAQLGVPGSGKLGVIQSSAIEESNVDLTQELVFMINQQRAYQANAQTIKTQDQILSTLVNLR
jgi:flagellar hook protein FlgE